MNDTEIIIDKTLESALNTFIEAAYSAGLKSTDVQKLVRETWHDRYLSNKDTSIITLSKEEATFMSKLETFLNNHCDEKLHEKLALVSQKSSDGNQITSLQEFILAIAIVTFRMLNSKATLKIVATGIVNEAKKYYCMLHPKVKVCIVIKHLEIALKYLDNLTAKHNFYEYELPVSWKKTVLKNNTVSAATLVAMIFFEE